VEESCVRKDRRRHQPPRGLPPITRLHLDSKIREPKARNAALLALLRKAAEAGRGNEPRPFYSIREVGACFNYSRTRVSRIFDQLKAEDVLRGIWGSKTVLEPLRLDRQLRIRGVIAVLVPLESFIGDRVRQKLFRSLLDELWRLGFAARIWFYEASEAEQTAFIESLLAQKFDAIIWLIPSSRVTLLSHRLLDCGVRVIRVTEGQSIRSAKTALARHLENRAQPLFKTL